MSRRYTVAKKDANHVQIASALRSIGASVGESDGIGKSFPDLIVCLKDTVLIEVKVPDGRFSVAQLRFLAEWRGFSAFASTAEEAIKIARNPQAYALTEKDKLKILRIVMAYENKTKAKYPQIWVSTFEEQFKALSK